MEWRRRYTYRTAEAAADLRRYAGASRPPRSPPGWDFADRNRAGPKAIQELSAPSRENLFDFLLDQVRPRRLNCSISGFHE
jgi:hypothetical protein